jgi:hypothetical protein
LAVLVTLHDSGQQFRFGYNAAVFIMPATRSRSSTLILQSLAQETPSIESLSEEEWESVWVKVRNHCLTPYLHRRWEETGLLASLPSRVEERFRTARSQNTERNRRLLSKLEEIVATLGKHGIQPLVLKGLPLAHEYYQDLGLRVLYDLDLQIPAGELRRAQSVLGEIGYTAYDSTPGERSSNLLWRPEEYDWDEQGVFDPERPIFLELHTLPWIPRWHGFRLLCNLDLWKGCRLLEIEGVELQLPAEEKLLVQLAVHYAFNALESNARLMHLLDVALLVRLRGRDLNWPEILRDAHESQVASFCFLTLDLARRICGAEVPEQVWSDLRSGTPRRIVLWLGDKGVDAAIGMDLYRRDRSVIYHLHWGMATGWAERWRVLWYSVFSAWRQGKDWMAFCRRMANRIRHLLTMRG